jgi:hypothetical protein
VTVGTAGGPASTRTLLWSMTLANVMIQVDQTAVPLALPSIIDTVLSTGAAAGQTK